MRKAAEREDAMELGLKSSCLEENQVMAKRYTCDGEDVSLPLHWTDPPEGTRSFTLMVEDPDAPSGLWVHWLLYDLPHDVRRLDEGIPDDPILENGAKQGLNDFREVGYRGPCPPRGPAHRYMFKLYALDTMTNLKPQAGRQQLLGAIENHVLAQSTLTGLYKR